MVGALLTLGASDAAATHNVCFVSADDMDGDGLPDSCDPIPFDPDADGDYYKDSLEVFVGTDPLDNCSNDPSHAAFPPDTNNDNLVNISDIRPLKLAFQASADHPAYRPRVDFNVDEVVNSSDLAPFLQQYQAVCPWVPTPWDPVARLESGTTHFELAQVWFSNVGNVLVESDPAVPGLPTCEEVKRAADHWTNLADFTFSVGLTGNCQTTSDVRVIFRWDATLPFSIAAIVIPYTEPFRECTGGNPCHFAHWALILLNKNMPEMIGPDATRRHFTIPHELGHVVGQGHTTFPFDTETGLCPVEPWTIMGTPANCREQYGIHWVRPNDVVFTNRKY